MREGLFRLLRALRVVALGLGLLVLLLVLALQVPAIATRVVNAALSGAAPLPRAALSVERARIGWITRVELAGIRMARGDTLLADVRSVRVGLRPWSLLTGRIDLGYVEVDGARISSRLATEPPSEKKDEAALTLADLLRGRFYAGPDFELDRLAVHDVRYGALSASDPAGPELEDASVVVRDLRLGDTFTVTVDTLGLRYLPSDSVNGEAVLRLAARVDPGGFRLDTLLLIAPSSRVTGGGAIVLDARDSLETMGMRIHAAPLELADLSLFAPGADLSGRITADIELRGPRAERLSGSIEADLGAARFADLRFGPGRLRAPMTDGEIDLALDLAWEGARAKVTGVARPLDPSPAYDLTLDVDGMPRAFAPGARLDELAARVHPRLRARVHGQGYAGAGFAVDAELTEGDGRTTLAGRLVTTPTLEWTVERLELDSVDLGPWLGDSTRSAIDATLEAQGRHDANGAMDITASLSLAGSQYGPWWITEGRATARFDGSELAARLAVTTDYGNLEVTDATADFRTRGPFRIRSARLSRVNLAPLTDDPTLESDLNGTLRVEGRGLADMPRGTRADLRLSLDPSRVRGVDVTAGEIALTLRDGTLQLASDLMSSAGRVEIRADARPFESPLRAELTRVRFDSLDLGAWSLTPVPTNLNGRLAGQIELPTRDAGDAIVPLSIAATLDLEASRAGGLAVRSGSVTGKVAHDALEARGLVSTDAGTTAFDADAVFTKQGPRGAGRFRVPLAALTEFAGYDTLDTEGELHLDARFIPGGVEPMRVTVELTGEGRIDAWQIDSLFASVAFQNGVLDIDTLGLASDAIDLSSSGAVALGEDAPDEVTRLEVRGDIRDASPLRALVGADTLALVQGYVEATLMGTPSARRLHAFGTVGSLAWNDLRILDARLEADGRLAGDWQPDSARMVAELQRIRASGIYIDSAGMEADFDGRELVVGIDMQLDRAHRARLEASGTRDSSETVVRLSTLRATGPVGRWSLTRPATMRFGEGRFTIDDLEVRSDSGVVRAAGVIARSGEEDLRVEADNVYLDFVTAWLGRPDLGGLADGRLVVSGTAAQPSADGALRVSLRNSEGPAGEIDARLDWDGRRAEVGLWFATPSGDSLKAAGHVPFALSFERADSADGQRPARMLAGEADFRVTARDFPLSALDPLMPPYAVGALRGTLNSDLRFHGRAQDLTGEGSLRLADASIPIPSLGVTYEDLRLVAEIRDDEFVIREAHASSGNGTLDLGGSIRFASRTRIEPNLEARWDRFLFVDTPDLRVRTSAELKVAGTLTAPDVTGRITAGGCKLQLEPLGLGAVQDGEDIVLTPDDVRMMEETFGYQSTPAPSALAPVFDNSNIDLRVTLARDNWVRNGAAPRLAMEVTGDVHVRKPPGGELDLRGSLSPVAGRGYIEHFGRTFDFAGGEVLLNGRAEDHRVDLRTEYKVRSPGDGGEPEVIVHMNLTADADEMRLVLSSEPPLSEAEILSYITTGRNPTKPESAESAGSAADLATDMGLSAVTSALGGAVQEQISLDVLQVRYDAIQGATLVAGRYVDPSLYIGIQQPLQYREKSTDSQGSFRTAVEVDYEAYRWLVLNLQGEASLVRAFLRAHHAY